MKEQIRKILMNNSKMIGSQTTIDRPFGKEHELSVDKRHNKLLRQELNNKMELLFLVGSLALLLQLH